MISNVSQITSVSGLTDQIITRLSRSHFYLTLFTCDQIAWYFMMKCFYSQASSCEARPTQTLPGTIWTTFSKSWDYKVKFYTVKWITWWLFVKKRGNNKSGDIWGGADSFRRIASGYTGEENTIRFVEMLTQSFKVEPLKSLFKL